MLLVFILSIMQRSKQQKYKTKIFTIVLNVFVPKFDIKFALELTKREDHDCAESYKVEFDNASLCYKNKITPKIHRVFPVWPNIGPAL